MGEGRRDERTKGRAPPSWLGPRRSSGQPHLVLDGKVDEVRIDDHPVGGSQGRVVLEEKSGGRLVTAVRSSQYARKRATRTHLKNGERSMRFVWAEWEAGGALTHGGLPRLSFSFPSHHQCCERTESEAERRERRCQESSKRARERASERGGGGRGKECLGGRQRFRLLFQLLGIQEALHLGEFSDFLRAAHGFLVRGRSSRPPDLLGASLARTPASLNEALRPLSSARTLHQLCGASLVSAAPLARPAKQARAAALTFPAIFPANIPADISSHRKCQRECLRSNRGIV